MHHTVHPLPVAREGADVGIISRVLRRGEAQAVDLARLQQSSGVKHLRQIGDEVPCESVRVGGHLLGLDPDLRQAAGTDHEQVVGHDVDVFEHKLDGLARLHEDLRLVVKNQVRDRADDE